MEAICTNGHPRMEARTSMGRKHHNDQVAEGQPDARSASGDGSHERDAATPWLGARAHRQEGET